MRPLALNTGGTMPPIGFGTWDLVPDAVAQTAVLEALRVGYRAIDTAAVYGNERGVGEAIRASGIPRHEIRVITKVWNDAQGYDRTLEACHTSLETLGLDYIDLYMIHWPASTRRHDSWRAMHQLYEQGLIKAAGVSNYTIEHLKLKQQLSPYVPAVNQIEFHPYIYEQQREVLDYCQQQGILVQAYSPLSRSLHRPPSIVLELADKYGKTTEQILLRWCIEHGTMPLPRSGNPQHIRSNFEVFDFTLDDEDLEQLDAVSDGRRVTWDPAGMGQHS